MILIDPDQIQLTAFWIVCALVVAWIAAAAEALFPGGGKR
jgi:hypothetical protein